ncbi:MAG: riboflavin synthase subunit alpha [SAR86 cluster bacterium BACL1 MAG-120828-bin5]|jgi:riboflavin synthase|uniref:Riboflavin synthase n=1 Tax=SAR86 cluster bacterium BACL1 MAG-120820-bin45 TaxID=1655612 RepID=A0A0R2UG55_9GAMM|nr:MAG: riboflavin synthase subunit alpha [SAR86 cluster bacterium BACL1 MAG-120507-bin14]KRO96371.1 MAG: riboflavin synthase subunit alpha [SAR86 cluster bacterium BACL1 MAG-120820-bin45]KRO97662.1 MAG: riboflavin synthase subunit alpha [SAR86 cluster bacterium BACL1 MAG-120828-bin5]KRP00532.1 MAG: riboflavin synthase subunit alpha [SAR86 cluster bacterium BACL1 MAG-120813-bin36]KRP09943.1 MAG: riboflavin synthase subunit alpha [SAR86 cluster bacterium BACL1 MAG-121004-bin11]KRP17159.1 MAG: r
MFTGIVTAQGLIKRIQNQPNYTTLSIKAPKGFAQNLKRGASVAVNGVCLTVKKGSTNHLEFDVITETLDKTNLKLLNKNEKVNLERSMVATSEIGGHLVSGHIFGVGVIKSINDRGDTKDLRIQAPAAMMQYLFYKGYIALNGCSLTVGKVLKSSFNIHLIPETIKVTNFQSLQKGDLVNIEIDQTTLNIVETIKKIMLEKKA